MSGLGSKTPVSCLQEYLVSKKIIPQYELCKVDGGSHNPEFTYRVQVQSLWEEGKGRSKQEAKHRAAEKMLKSLKVTDAKAEEEEIITGLSNEVMENYVGQLKELCISMHYPEPKYDLEEAAGPPHSRVFKMICCVSQMQTFGIKTTKKQAKHQAAFNMLQHLQEVGGNKVKEALFQIETNKTFPFSATDEEINEKYSALKTNNVPIVKDPAAYYKDNHRAYVGLQESSPTLMEIVNESNVIDSEDSIRLIGKISEELKAGITTVDVPTKKEGLTFTIITMSICPPIGGVGLNKKNAAFNLLNSLLFLCKDR